MLVANLTRDVVVWVIVRVCSAVLRRTIVGVDWHFDNLSGSHHQMMASAPIVETSVNTNNSPSQDYTTNPDDHSNHNIDSPGFKPFTVILTRDTVRYSHSRLNQVLLQDSGNLLVSTVKLNLNDLEGKRFLDFKKSLQNKSTKLCSTV